MFLKGVTTTLAAHGWVGQGQLSIIDFLSPASAGAERCRKQKKFAKSLMVEILGIEPEPRQLALSLNPGGGPSENRTRVLAMRMPRLTTGP